MKGIEGHLKGSVHYVKTSDSDLRFFGAVVKIIQH
jgi:hypothetical protein